MIFYKRGYQQFSSYNSVTTAKVKGVVSTLEFRDEEFVASVAYPAAYRRIWDISDLVVPPSVSRVSIQLGQFSFFFLPDLGAFFGECALYSSRTRDVFVYIGCLSKVGSGRCVGSTLTRFFESFGCFRCFSS